MKIAPTLSKSDQAELTKLKLISVARRYFAQYGYTHTSSDDIVKATGLTRGALYHHFQGKEGLFLAVVEQLQHEIAREIEQAVKGIQDPFEQLLTGSRTFIEAASKKDIQRLLLVEAPAVIGWERWRQMDAENSLVLLKENLAELQQQKIIKPYPLDALAHLLSGAMNEAVLWAAEQKQPFIAIAEVQASLEEMLLSLRINNWQE